MKRLLALLCSLALVFCLLPSTAFAEGGNGNIDGGGGNMGQGTSSNFWNPGNDGVRITVVDADSGTAISSPVDFSNRVQKNSVLHFGKVNKLQYLGGTALSLQSGVAYSCIKPAQSMPTIVSSKGQSNIEAIKRYFCSEYACQMVAQAAGVDYERMIAGDYKLLIEPIAYFTHNGQYYCMTATEAALYDQKSGGALRKTMTSLTHKNLPLSMFLEFSDLGLPAWTGSTTSKQSNADIISSLGVGIVWFDERPPEGEIEAPDVEYRVDTDVITSVTLRTDTDLTPDNPASVTFHILGTTYRVNDIVIPAGDSQVVWVKWHTPSTPQSVTITVSVSGAYTAQDTFVAEIVDLNEHNLIKALERIAENLSALKQSLSADFVADPDFLHDLYYGDYEPSVFKTQSEHQKQLNHNASMAEELLRQKMGNSPEAIAAFEAYQLAAGECSSIVAEQAFESGFQTAVQMLVAGLIPPENKFAAEVPLTTQELRKMDGEQVFCLDMNEEVRVVARKKGFIQVTNDKEIHRITGLTLYRHRPSWCQ